MILFPTWKLPVVNIAKHIKPKRYLCVLVFSIFIIYTIIIQLIYVLSSGAAKPVEPCKHICYMCLFSAQLLCKPWNRWAKRTADHPEDHHRDAWVDAKRALAAPQTGGSIRLLAFEGDIENVVALVSCIREEEVLCRCPRFFAAQPLRIASSPERQGSTRFV